MNKIRGNFFSDRGTLLLLFVFVHLFPSPAFAQMYPQLKFSENESNLITKEGLLEDLDHYRDAVIKLHTNPFTVVRKKVFVSAIENIKDSADHYDADQILTELLKVNAMIGDQHTGILYVSRDIFPFRCYWFEEGIYITATAKAYEHLRLSKLIAINNVPIDDVVSRISLLIPEKTSSNIRHRTVQYIFDPFILHGLQISTDRKSVSYTIVTPGNDTLLVRPEAVNRQVEKCDCDDRSFFKAPDKKIHSWFTYIDSSSLIYFRYSSCYDDSSVTVQKLDSELTKCIEQKKPQKLIIDLRYNSGGYSSLLDHFINYLANSKFGRRGRLYVLVDRGTFSAAVINANSLRELTYAKIVGEEAGGPLAFFAGVKYHKLPHTKLRLIYSTMYWQSDRGKKGTLMPDVIIPETLANYMAGRDAALEYAICY